MFKITITETREVKIKYGMKWEPISSTSSVDQIPGETKYGYTPLVEKMEMQDIQVLHQTVDKVDLVAVIKAINGIGSSVPL